ncbi:Endospore coat-associated protein YheD [Paenibacillus sp. CECT 9249]|nr:MULTISPECIES: YheC/YheD family protein [unclassified Paenibacillus]MBU5441971.1 YheC/YheD family protein [Paenibacillus sp. MSJ-34]CAH0121886.1 Endospore coat-associated protein YheD [Paenibacillus sp. CECT 9249]
MAIQRVFSKWAKTKTLLKNSKLQNCIPETRKMNAASLKSMLDQYNMVYVKPVRGTYGIGVMLVEKHSGQSGGADHYRYHVGTESKNFASYERMYLSLMPKTRGKPYIVQRGIHLLKHRKRRFDIRVMVQKNLQDEWETTGIIGRLAAPQKVVTNYHSGGKPLSFSKLMSSHLNPAEKKQLAEKLKILGVTVGRQLEKSYPRLKELGLDVAIDEQFKPWVLEVNTCPDPFIFRNLKNKKIFRKMYRYALHYGRYKPRKKS